MNKPVLPFVETMITQSCNLSCYGCTNYSDLIHSGYVKWSEGKRDLETWMDRVDILDFGIMGGEPLVNPECEQWIAGARNLLPNSQIRFTTNGIRLEKHWNIVRLLSDIGNCVFKITVHVSTVELEQSIKKIFNSYKWTPVFEYGIRRWVTNNGFKFQVNRPKTFVKSYRNDYANMAPYENDPNEAFANCCQQTCPLLYNGRLYKCSTAGLLKDTLIKLGRPNMDQWEPVIDYGIDPTCSEMELKRFVDNFGKPNGICRQCPTEHDSSAILDHSQHVTFKKNQ